MNIFWEMRRLGKIPAARKLVKSMFASIYQDGKIYSIRMGPLKGQRWYMHKDHQFWMPLGQYESQTASWITSRLQPGACFYDIGANAGYFTILGSLAVGGGGEVHAFEPVPVNVEVLAKQITTNHLANVVLQDMALSNEDGEASFTVEDNNANSHLAKLELPHAKSRPTTSVSVRTATMDKLVADGLRKPDVIKIDVEGAEVLVLEGAVETLKKHRPTLLISTHSSELHSDVCELLRSLNFNIRPLAGFEHELVATPT